MQDAETQDLRVYEVFSHTTGEKSFQVATYAQDACLQAAWQIGDCYVHYLEPHRRAAPGQEVEWRVLIPCHTCPFQYADCTKPDDVDCPVNPQAPEMSEWLKQATEAHLCPYQGNVLTKKDHTLGQKWLTIREAIKELAPKHLSVALNSPQ